MTRSSITDNLPDVAPLAVSMGEPAGIGPDVTLAAWSRRLDRHIPPFYVNADPALLQDRAAVLSKSIPIQEIDHPSEAISVFADALPTLPLASNISGTAGRPAPSDPPLILQSLEMCMSQCLDGTASAMVTSPINKAALYADGFEFQGHTDFLANRLSQSTGTPVAELMMLCAPELKPPLRVVPITIHTALNQVADALTMDGIVQAGRQLHAALVQDFDIAQPRIAVAGLNPHAGEKGALGREELEIIAPAIQALQDEGIAANGPSPADTLFHAEAREHFDAVLCMYHDQALIPIKTLDFHGGVNVTLGLPIIRTSPDHGTAYDIAGSGDARPDSMIAALKMAASMASQRQKAQP